MFPTHVLGRLAAGLAVAAIALAPLAAVADTVLAVGDQKGNARAVLEASGALDGIPYTIEWSEFPAAAPLLEALNAGAIDAGTVGDAPFTFAVASGAAVKAVLATRQGQEGLAVVVAKDSPAQSFADLKGKKIATGRGSIGHQLVLAALEKGGLKPADVELVFLTPSEAKAALLTGAIDAWSTWEPYTSQLEIIEGARRVVDGSALTPGLGFFVASPKAIEEKRAALEDLVGRLARARAWAADHPEQYAKVWSGIIGLPEAVAISMHRRARARAVPIDAGVIAAEQETVDLYARAGLIKPFMASDALDASFNAAVVKAVGGS